MTAEPRTPEPRTPEPRTPERRETDPVAIDPGPTEPLTDDVALTTGAVGPTRDEATIASVSDEPLPPGSRTAPADRGDELVVMHGVSRKFDDRVVVRGIDLAVPRGTILGIIGPSGAGKTTTIRMLTGALAPSSGEVRVLGREPRRFRRKDREQIGYMPQQFTLYEDLTAGENIDFVASLFGMLWRRRRKRVKDVLKVVDLWEARGRRAGQLSGGMQRRLELACALVHEPELMILDEPTAGIDPLLRGTIWDELHRLRDAGRTLLVTTQHISEAEECDAVAMIVSGEIIALAPPEELRRMATNGDLLDIETATGFDGSDLMGTPGVGEVTQESPHHFRVVVDDAGSALPSIVERIQSAGVEVESAAEHRLSFDEIFAILVSRHDAEMGAAAGTGESGGRPEAGDSSEAAA
jgi:ABC-2 type transport system ATP-binding protein